MRDRRTRGRAMEQPRQTEFTADEFIAWAMEQPSGRYELDDGQVVGTAPERVRHNLAKLNAAVALRDAVAASGLPCRVFTDGMAVEVDERTVYEPDAMLRCGPPLPGDAVKVPDPLVVVEVLSPSTKAIDSGRKLVGYFALPSVRHYLIVDIKAQAAIHHRRDEDGGIGVRVLSDGVLALEPPGLAIEVRDLFEGA
ncbi:MAG: Uma2 family endonuclease [Amaricoccus sp.]